MWFTFPDPNPAEVGGWWKQKQSCHFPPHQIRCHSLSLAMSQTLTGFLSEQRPGAIAHWAIFQTKTLLVKYCFFLWLWIQSVWISSREKNEPPVLASRRHVQYPWKIYILMFDILCELIHTSYTSQIPSGLGGFFLNFRESIFYIQKAAKIIFFIIILFDHESNHHSFKVYLIFIHTSQTQVVFHPKKSLFFAHPGSCLRIIWLRLNSKTTRCAEVFFIWRLGVLYSSGLMGKHGIPCLCGLMLLHNSYISCLRPTDK